MDEIYDLIDTAAKAYPLKSLAAEVDKAESTLRNELTRQPGYKLGLSTAILILQKTGNLAALDKIEEQFGRMALDIPQADALTPTPLMIRIAAVSKQFAQCVEAMARSLKQDGTIAGAEIYRCLKSNADLIKGCLELDLYLRRLYDQEQGKNKRGSR